MSKTPDLFTHIQRTEIEAVQWLNELFFEMMLHENSDIHFSEHRDYWLVRVRLPSGLRDWARIPTQMGEIISKKIIARCNFDPANKYSPEDGRFRLIYSPDNMECRRIVEKFGETLDAERALDVRVNLSHPVTGNYFVMRLLDQNKTGLDINQLGLPDEQVVVLKQIAENPEGLFLVTGPTGSGKTTTLYSMLALLNNGRRNILTIEDPVEYTLPGIFQFNVDNDNLTFAKQLKAALREDPDVILVGEIRDAETAQVAIRAASTGHLVLSTLHTNNALQAVWRLLDLGVDPHQLALSLAGISAQRLLPCIDSSIAEVPMIDPGDADVFWLDMAGQPSRNVKIPDPSLDTSGRRPVMELLMADKNVRTAVSNQDFESLKKSARMQPWYAPLAEAGAALVFEGKVHMHDLRRLVVLDTDLSNDKRYLVRLIESGEISLEIAKKAVQMQTRYIISGVRKPIGEIVNEIVGSQQDHEAERMIG